MSGRITASFTSDTKEQRRSHAPYAEIRARLPEVVNSRIPRDAIVLVVSKGDEQLTKFDHRRGWHFLRHDSGKYAGHHPADSEEAIEQLEELRELGANYLVVPATAYWWFDYYADFSDYVESRARTIYGDDDICRIFFLGDDGDAQAPIRPTGADRRRLVAEQIGEFVRALVPDDAKVAIAGAENERLPDLAGRSVFRFRIDDREVADEPRPAMAHLEALRAKGAEFLIVPKCESWLDDRSGLAHEIGRHYPQLAHQENLCWAFDLTEQPGHTSFGALAKFFRRRRNSAAD